MHKKIPKIWTGCRVSEAKIYLYHSTKIAKARPHSEEWQTDTSVQKQRSMIKYIGIAFSAKKNLTFILYDVFASVFFIIFAYRISLNKVRGH